MRSGLLSVESPYLRMRHWVRLIEADYSLHPVLTCLYVMRVLCVNAASEALSKIQLASQHLLQSASMPQVPHVLWIYLFYGSSMLKLILFALFEMRF